MRPRNVKGKRWSRAVESPRYVENAAWRQFQNAVRDLLGEPALPGGLEPEEYLVARVQRLTRYEDYLRRQLEVTGSSPEQRLKDEAAASSQIEKLPIGPDILLVSNFVWSRLIQDLSKRPGQLRSVGHRAFEELVAHLFEEFGYVVELTSQTRDGGRDIIAVRNAEVDSKYLIECKHPRTDTKIGIATVRELFAVKVDEKATKAILATTSYLTRDAQLFVERHKWELEARDFDGVMEWVRRVGAKQAK